MRFSIEFRNRTYVRGYGFLSFDKDVGKILSKKYSQKPFHTSKKSTTVDTKAESKDAIQKLVEAAGELIGNKFAYKIKHFSNKKPLQSDLDEK